MMSRAFVATCMAAVLCLGLEAQDAKQGPIAIEVPKRDKPVDFRADLLPFLKTNCIACHHAKDPEGSLVLESPKSILKGGDSGPAVVPGKSGESLLLKVASHSAKPVMPPRKNKVGAGTLTPQQLGLIKLWIDQGAKESLLAEIEAPRWQPVTGNWHPIYAVGLDADGQFAACGRAGHLFLYHVPTGRLIDQPSDPKLKELVPPGTAGLADRDAVLSLAFSPDGSRLATGGYRSIRLWKKVQPETKSKIELPADAKAIAMSRDGAKLAYAGAGNVVKVVDLKTGKPVAELKGHADAVTSIKFAGELILTGSADKTARAWKADGAEAGKLTTPAAVAAVEAIDKQIATAGGDGVIRVWADLAATAPAKEIKAAATELRAVTGGLLSAGADGKLTLWNVETGKSVREANHGAPITGVAVTPDGRRWLTVGGPTATVWNADDGKKIADLKTDGPAAKRDRQAAALLAFAAAEVTFRQAAVKAQEDIKKKEEAEVTVATTAVAPSEKNVKDKEDALAKARADREAADKAVSQAELDAEAAKERLELAINALAITDPEMALKQAEADNAAVIQYLDGTAKNPKMAVDAKIRAEAAGRMLAFGRAAIAHAKNKPAESPDAAVKAAAEAKIRAEGAKKAVDEAKKKLESVTAEADKKAAEEALKKAEAELAAATQAAQSTEAARVAAVEAAKKAADAGAQTKVALDAATKAMADARTNAEAAIKAAETARTAALPKKDTTKKAEDAAAGAVDIAKANLDSAKGRVEKAKEAVVAVDKAIVDANAKLEAQKAEQAKLDADRKAAAEALVKAKLNVRSGAFSSDGAFVVLGGEDGKVYAFGTERGAEAGVTPAHEKAVVAVGGAGVSVAADGTMRVAALLPSWKLETVIEPSESSKPPIDRVLALAFSPDGAILASGGGMPSRDGELLLWNAADGSLLREIAGAHSDTVFDLAFTTDGALLASAAADKFARVFDAKTGKLVRSFEGHTNHVLGVAWNRTGRTLATSGADEVIKVWSLESGQQIRTIQGFTKQATSLRYVGYDASFAVAAGGVPVRLVTEAGNVARNFDSAGAFMYDLSLSSDGSTIAAGGLDGILRLWTVADGKSIGTFAPPTAAK
jgi:WD40 repeat protein